MHCISKVTARKESFHSENTRAIKSGVIRQTILSQKKYDIPESQI